MPIWTVASLSTTFVTVSPSAQTPQMKARTSVRRSEAGQITLMGRRVVGVTKVVTVVVMLVGRRKGCTKRRVAIWEKVSIK